MNKSILAIMFVLFSIPVLAQVSYCPDINGDNVINSVDQAILSSGIGKSNCDPWNCDLNSDGIITDADMQLISLNYLKSTSLFPGCSLPRQCTDTDIANSPYSVGQISGQINGRSYFTSDNCLDSLRTQEFYCTANTPKKSITDCTKLGKTGCIQGICTSGCNPSACSQVGAICCAGISGCVNPWADSNNCGACGNKCQPGVSCLNGKCSTPTCTTPVTETCNNKDDNCNGQIDEGLIKITTCGVGACTSIANQGCSAGQWLPACIPKNPASEICSDGIDNNCNGQIDEGCGITCGSSCITQSQFNQEAINYNKNIPGSKCIFMYQGMLYVPPASTVVNGVHMGAISCGSNADGLIPTSHLANIAHYLTPYMCAPMCSPTPACDPKSPNPETCNNMDDNCNGQIDEGLSKTVSCGVGACARSLTQTCSKALWGPACVPGTPISEICGDGIDNNCDGQIDEGCSVCSQSASLTNNEKGTLGFADASTADFKIVPNNGKIYLKFNAKTAFYNINFLYRKPTGLLGYGNDDTNSLVVSELQPIRLLDYFPISKAGNTRILKLISIKTASPSSLTFQELSGVTQTIVLDSLGKGALNFDGYTYSLKANFNSVIDSGTIQVDMNGDDDLSDSGIVLFSDTGKTFGIETPGGFNVSLSGGDHQRLTFTAATGSIYDLDIIKADASGVGLYANNDLAKKFVVNENSPINRNDYFIVSANGLSRIIRLTSLRNTSSAQSITVQDVQYGGTSQEWAFDPGTGIGTLVYDGNTYRYNVNFIATNDGYIYIDQNADKTSSCSNPDKCGINCPAGGKYLCPGNCLGFECDNTNLPYKECCGGIATKNTLDSCSCAGGTTVFCGFGSYPPCGSACPSTCIQSNCAQFGTICCPGINGCINEFTDVNNCGKCGNKCQSGASCLNGQCSNPVCTPEEKCGDKIDNNCNGQIDEGCTGCIGCCQSLDSLGNKIDNPFCCTNSAGCCGDGKCSPWESDKDGVNDCLSDCQSKGCIDSDGGKNIYLKGFVTNPDYTIRQEDKCIDANYLQEYYCPNPSLTEFAVTKIWCPWGCANSACQKPGILPTGLAVSNVQVPKYSFAIIFFLALSGAIYLFINRKQ